MADISCLLSPAWMYTGHSVILLFRRESPLWQVKLSYWLEVRNLRGSRLGQQECHSLW